MTAANGQARDGPSPTRRLLRGVRRTFLWHRRLVAAVLAAAAVAAGLTVVRPPPVETVTVVAAARDLPGGTRVTYSFLQLLDVV
jgi:hypothetical protein